MDTPPNAQSFIGNGKYLIPTGVYVEQFFDGDREKLLERCPSIVNTFLVSKGLKAGDGYDESLKFAYEKFMEKLTETSTDPDHSCWNHEKGIWNMHKIRDVVDNFITDFAEKGVKLSVSLLGSGSATQRYIWLEYADLTIVGYDYESKYDICKYKEVHGGQHFVPPGVVVEELVDINNNQYGKRVLKKECPIEVSDFLNRKGLKHSYDKMVEDIVNSKETYKWKMYWTTKAMLPLVEKYQQEFERQGVQVALCKKVDSDWVYKWLEFIDIEAVELYQYVPKHSVDDKAQSQQGHASTDHFVPNGVVIEELENYNLMEISKKDSLELKELLESKDLITTYDRFVRNILDSEHIDNILDVWIFKRDECAPMLQRFRNEMAKKGVLVRLCERNVKKKKRRWLEYVDTSKVSNYTSLYDVENLDKMARGKYALPQGVFVEQLVDNNKKKLEEECPTELLELLSRKNLVSVYDSLINVLVENGTSSYWTGSCSWKSSEIIAALNQFKDEFACKGVKVILCGHQWDAETFRWLEFIDTSVAENYEPRYDLSKHRIVLHGKHSVPMGVEIEEILWGEGKKLVQECPQNVKELLERKDLMTEYEHLVQALYEENSTRNWAGMWKTSEMLPIVREFENKFCEKGIKLALCKRKSGDDKIWWFEFIDTSRVKAEEYVPQYDVANIDDDQELKTNLVTLKFPNGVAIEQFIPGGHSKLREEIPPAVEKMLTKKDLLEEYQCLMDSLSEYGVDSKGRWCTDKIISIARWIGPEFSKKGVAVFISHKQEEAKPFEWQDFRWIEFVDRDIQPNYYPQRDVDRKKSIEGNITIKQVLSVTIAVGVNLAFHLI